MIVASLLLVIAAAVTLLIGLLNRETLEWVYASIASCLLAGLLLTIGVLRSRPSRKPVLQSGGEGQGASWAGAASQWGDDRAGTDVLTRDEHEEPETGPEPVGDDEPTQTSLTTTPTSADDEEWAPSAADDDVGGDVRVVPAADAEEAEPTEAAATPAETPLAADRETSPAEPEPSADEDVVVVPKPSARGDAADTPPSAETAEAETPAAAAAASSASRKSPAAREAKPADDAARFEQVLKPIAGVGPAKRKALHAHFGTYRKLRAASPEKIAAVPGISRALADRIHQALHGG